MNRRQWIVAGVLALVSWAGIAADSAHAQVNNAGPLPAGVIVDADGVLRIKVAADPTGALTRQRFAEARGKLPPDVARPSALRKISLNRLERALAERLARGEDASDDMKYLVGLTRISHVFYYPETRDIVLAGPAEGYALDITGRPVGMQSGRAVVELQDLVAALRAYPPTGDRLQRVLISIDPSQEGLQRLNQFLASVGTLITRNRGVQIAQGIKEALGLQKVTIEGISDRTHFAQVLVEADYRMKLISVAIERPPVNIGSYAERANPRTISRNALARFYFTPNYDCVRVSDDRLAMQLVGDGVQLITEQELVTAAGERVDSRNVNEAAEAFAKSFTEKYGELAARSPVYAQMRNLIDLLIACAYIQQNDFYGQSDWDLGVLAKEDLFPIETYTTPKMVESAVNVLWRGNVLMTPIGGGVNIQPLQALRPDRLLRDENGQLVEQRSEINPAQIPADQWWWD